MKSGKDQAIPTLGNVIGRLLEAERVTAAAPTDLRARVMSRARCALAQPVARPFRRPRAARQLRFAVAAALLLAGAGTLAGMHGGWGGGPRDLPVATSAGTAARPVAAGLGGPAAAPDLAQEARAIPRPRARGRDPRVELELLEQAQEAVRAERFEAALAILEAHVRRFPNGALVEERQALLVRTLSSLGRNAEARRAGAAFRRRFPRSVLGQRVGEIPAARE